MVAVVQLVEHQVVILGVAGSSPVSHPQGKRTDLGLKPRSVRFFFVAPAQRCRPASRLPLR